MTEREILKDIAKANKKELDNAMIEKQRKKEDILYKYKSFGEYKVTTNECIKKNYSSFFYKKEKIVVKYYEYSKVRKSRIEQVCVGYTSPQSVTTTDWKKVDIDSVNYDDINGDDISVDMDDKIHYKGNKYKVDINGDVYKEVNNTIKYGGIPRYENRTVYYDGIKTTTKYLKDEIYIKKVVPGCKTKLEALENELARDIDLYLKSTKFLYNVEANALSCFLLGLLEFIVPLMYLFLLVIFPKINSYDLNYGCNYDYVADIILYYCPFINNPFSKVGIIIFSSIILFTYISIFFLRCIIIKDKVKKPGDRIINFISKMNFALLLLNASYHIINHYLIINGKELIYLNLLGSLITLTKNALYFTGIIMLIYGLIVFVFNVYVIRIKKYNKFAKAEKAARKEFKELQYPRLRDIQMEIKKYTK